MASPSQVVFCLLILIGLFAFSQQGAVRKICMHCVNGRNCETQVCEINQDSCATVTDKDGSIILQECVMEKECTELNTNAHVLRRQLQSMTAGQKRILNQFISSLLPEALQQLKSAGLDVDIEELSHYTCEACDFNKCNADPSQNELIA